MVYNPSLNTLKNIQRKKYIIHQVKLICMIKTDISIKFNSYEVFKLCLTKLCHVLQNLKSQSEQF